MNISHLKRGFNMEFIFSLTIFIILGICIIELIININILATFGGIKKIIDKTYDHLSDINFERSTGRPQSFTDLSLITSGENNWMPQALRNHLPIHIKEKITYYLREDGIGCRDRSMKIALNLINNEKWLFDLRYEDLQRIIHFLRLLYIPIGTLSAIIIFSMGYSSMTGDLFDPTFNGITKNIFTISITMKTAGKSLMACLIAYLFSMMNSILFTKKKTTEELSEAIFQMKTNNLKILLD